MSIIYPILAAVAVSAGADGPKPAALKAQDVLDRMAAAYAGCKSYIDSGVVTTVFDTPDGKQRTTEVRPFTTAFVRPDQFRYEFSMKGGGPARHFVVWRKGKDVQIWWSFNLSDEQRKAYRKSLSSALAGADVLADGSALTIPALLLPKEVEGRRLTDLKEAKRIEDDKIDKVECFRIQGKYADTPMTLWIDQKTFLVRRIVTLTQVNFRLEVTTNYTPAIDVKIEEKKLEFGHPKE
jgi:outer membrane lipoprotein-sorting protein